MSGLQKRRLSAGTAVGRMGAGLAMWADPPTIPGPTPATSTTPQCRPTRTAALGLTSDSFLALFIIILSWKLARNASTYRRLT